MTATTFWCADDKPVSAAPFIEVMFGEFPKLFKDEDELRSLWGKPDPRKSLLEKLSEAGFGLEPLSEIAAMTNAEKSDLFDVLAYITFAKLPITRSYRVEARRADIPDGHDFSCTRSFTIMPYAPTSFLQQ